MCHSAAVTHPDLFVDWPRAVRAYVMCIASLDALREELVSKFDIKSTGHFKAKPLRSRFYLNLFYASDETYFEKASSFKHLIRNEQGPIKMNNQ